VTGRQFKNPSSALVDLGTVTFGRHVVLASRKVSNGSQFGREQEHRPLNAVSLSTPTVALTANTTNGPVAKLTSTSGASRPSSSTSSSDCYYILNFGSSVVSKTAERSKVVDLKGFALRRLRPARRASAWTSVLCRTVRLEQLVKQLNRTVECNQGRRSGFRHDHSSSVERSCKTVALNNALASAPSQTRRSRRSYRAWPQHAHDGRPVAGHLRWQPNDDRHPLNAVTADPALLSLLPHGVTAAQTRLDRGAHTLGGWRKTLPACCLNVLDTPIGLLRDVLCAGCERATRARGGGDGGCLARQQQAGERSASAPSVLSAAVKAVCAAVTPCWQ